MSAARWYRELFGEDYYRMYGWPSPGSEAAARQAEQVAALVASHGRRVEYHLSLRLYTPRELALMLEAAGLQAEALHGGLDASPLTLDSWRLAVVGRKATRT